MALTQIKTGGLANNSVTNAKMADNAIDSVDIAAGSIDNAHLAGSIAVSKTLLAGGTGLTLSTNTLNVDAAQTQITSVGTLTGLTVSGDVNFDSNTLFVDASENKVGIGTANPKETFEVAGYIANWRLYSTSGISNGALAFNSYYNGSAWVHDDDSKVSLNMYMSDSRDSLEFSVRAGGATAGSGSTHMAIMSDGKVGIGTTSPSSLLHVKTTANVSETIRIQNDDSLTTVGVSSDGYSFHTYQHSLYWASWDGSTWSTKGRMDSSGNLGVGTTDFNNMSSSSYAGLKVGGATLQDSGGGNGSATFLSNNAYVGGSNNMYHDGGGACSSIGMTQGDIYFYTFDGGGGSADAQWTTTTRLHITETGSVGIGLSNTSVNNKFQVQVATDHRIGFWGDSTYSAIQSVNDANNVLKKLRFDASEYHIIGGKVGIGTDSPAEKLTVNDGDILVSSGRGVRANGGQEMIRFNSSDGVLINSGNSLRMQFYRSGEVDLQGVYGENVGSGAGTRAVRISSGGRVGVDTSSKRFKTNISDIKNTNWIQDLRVVDFVWKKDNSKDWGLIAEEVEKIKPELVSMDDDGKPFSVHYDKLTVLLLKQIQELTAKVKELENA